MLNVILYNPITGTKTSEETQKKNRALLTDNMVTFLDVYNDRIKTENKLNLIKSGKPGNKILVNPDHGMTFQTDPIQIIVKKMPDKAWLKDLILGLDVGLEFREFMSTIQEYLEVKFKKLAKSIELYELASPLMNNLYFKGPNTTSNCDKPLLISSIQ